MRILYCSTTYPPHLNGEAIFTKSLAEGIAKQGHQVMVIYPAKCRSLTRDHFHGIQVVRIPAINLQRIHRDLWLAIVPTLSIPGIFKEFQPDVVHIQDPLPLWQAVRREAGRWKIPVVITHHSGSEITAPYLRMTHPFLKRITDWAAWKLLIRHLGQANVVTVPSKYSEQMLREQGIQVDIKIVPCGALADFHPNPGLDRKAVRQRYGLAPHKPLFLYIGRVDHEKNLDMILKAMAIAKDTDMEFAIAGQGMQELYLQQLMRQLGIGRRVHFLGKVDPSILADLLNSADIFVMPGNAESFSIATLEAMACAKPILAADAGALPELVTHKVNGYLFQSQCVEEAAYGIQTLASSADHWSTMGSSSEAKARQYSLDNVVRNCEQIHVATLRNAALAKVKSVEKQPGRPGAPTRQRYRSLSPGFLRTVFLILCILLSTFLYDQAQAISDLRITDLASLELPSDTRLLIVSPHPDDEVLAAGGLIQRVLETGGQVEIAMVTNGDGQYFAPLIVNRKIKPKPSDYIDIGRHRQMETLSALKEIGLDSDKVTFLGYPDGKINRMWSSNWQQTEPIRAPYTNTTKSLYENTYNQQAAYHGSELYKDLMEILQKYEPGVILLPHPEDTNPDHSAVSNFARFAIAGYLASGDHQAPVILAYLIHYELYPVPRGEDTSKVLLPPAALSNGAEDWTTLSLTPVERANKKDALQMYVSQQRMMPVCLKSFARANEIFFELPVIDLPLIVIEDNSVLETDLQIEKVRFEPTRERFDRLVLKNADLVGWKVSRFGDLVCFAAETRGPMTENVDYRIRARLPDGSTVQVSKKDDLIVFTDHLFGACFSLGDLGDPSSMGFSAETRSGVLLDHTAWHFVFIPDIH